MPCKRQGPPPVVMKPKDAQGTISWYHGYVEAAVSASELAPEQGQFTQVYGSSKRVSRICHVRLVCREFRVLWGVYRDP